MQFNIKRVVTSFCIIVVVLIATGNFTIRPAGAAGVWYVKNGGNDSSDCQTPAAACASINAALAKPGFVAGDTIRVAVGTYTGTGIQVVLINKDATLSGGWDAATFTTQSGMATIDGQGARRGITIGSGFTVTIDRFVIQNGFNPSFITGGGGINNDKSTLTVSNSTIISNTASYPASLSVGGGIYNNDGASILTIINSTIKGNIADSSGGGIYNNGGSVTVSNSSIISNTAGMPGLSGSSGGGGISNYGTLLVNSSSIADNTLLGALSGSGINNGAWICSDVTLNNSTISNNTNGEGISVQGCPVNLNNSTVVNNSRNGIYVSTGTVNLRNSIVANNGLGDCSKDPYFNGAIQSLGYNLVRDSTNCTLVGSDLTNLDPNLGSLQDNGGPTWTHALLPGSPAINAGNPSGCSGNAGALLTDQRGFPRAGVCDIGAYEMQALDLSYKTASPQGALPGETLTYNIIVKNLGGFISSAFVTDTLPAELDYISNTLHASSGSPSFGNRTITWIGSVSANGTVTITFDAKINSAFSSIINTAALGANGIVITRSAKVDKAWHLFLPLISRPPAIYGYVTDNGSPAGGVPLELRFYNGSAWSTYATTSTASDGKYTFYPPLLGSQQRYYVRYLNATTNTRLSSWGTRQLTSFAGPSDVAIGNFDIANIPLVSPLSGNKVTLPSMFSWGVRPATPTDSYEFNLFDPTNPSLAAWTPPLGYVGSVTLNSLPSGFVPNVGYGWYMAVYSPDGGYGTSYYYRRVSFANTGASPMQRVPSRAQPQREDWRGKLPVQLQGK